MKDDRFARQKLLPEVGDAGQARIGASSLRLPTSLPEEVVEAARLYAGATGIPRVELEAVNLDEAPPSFRHAAHFRHAESRQLAHGVSLTFSTLKQALALPSAESDDPPSPEI